MESLSHNSLSLSPHIIKSFKNSNQYLMFINLFHVQSAGHFYKVQTQSLLQSLHDPLLVLCTFKSFFFYIKNLVLDIFKKK